MPPVTGTADEPLPVGEVATVGDWRLRVSGVSADATSMVLAENPFDDPPADGEQYFVATLQATYVGTESSRFSFDVMLRPMGPAGDLLDEFGSYCGVIPDAIGNAGEVFPGGTIEGNACWNVPSADVGSLILVAEPTFTTGQAAYLSLDPAAMPVTGSTSDGVTPALRPDAVRLGMPANVGEWTLRVASVYPDASGQILDENVLNTPPPDGEQFFLVTLEATHHGTGSPNVAFDLTLKAVGPSNVAYEDFVFPCGMIPDPLFFAHPDTNGTVTGNTCWSVRTTDATALEMLAEPTFSFGGTERVFFELSR